MKRHNKMENKKYLSDGTVLIIQKKIIERCKIDTFNIYIYIYSNLLAYSKSGLCT